MKKTLCILFLIPFVLALIAEGPRIANDPVFWTWRGALVMITGFLTVSWMAIAVILSTRKAWLEKKLGGLDKVYHLHKWVGIWAGICVLLHWLVETGVKKVGKWGIAELPPRIKAPKTGDPTPIYDWFKDFFQFCGEWAFYIGAALIIIALLKKTIPYKYFRLSHKIFPIIAIMGCSHALFFTLRTPALWVQPATWYTVIVAVWAIIISVMVLAGKLGKEKQVKAQITNFEKGADGTLDLTLTAPDWAGHQAGQFLFIHFGDNVAKYEGAHPFTIASAWDSAKKTIRLGIKPLGDFTKQLPNLIQKNQTVRIEGPYGDFIFNDDFAPQLWVAGGVGVTPFVARLEDLAQKGVKDANVDFFCSLRNDKAHFIKEMRELSQKTGVRLHLWLSEVEKSSLKLESISAAFKPDSNVYFCGPFQWGESLFQHLKGKGLADKNFHRERFEFR